MPTTPSQEVFGCLGSKLSINKERYKMGPEPSYVWRRGVPINGLVMGNCGYYLYKWSYFTLLITGRGPLCSQTEIMKLHSRKLT